MNKLIKKYFLDTQKPRKSYKQTLSKEELIEIENLEDILKHTHYFSHAYACIRIEMLSKGYMGF